MNLKAVIDDSNKNSEAKIKNINNIISANSTREAFFKPSYEELSIGRNYDTSPDPEAMIQLRSEKEALENKVKTLENEIISKNSKNDSGRTMEILKEQWDKEKRQI